MAKTLVVAVTLLLAAGVARAQTMARCYGLWAGSIGFALADSDGSSTLLPDPTGARFFGVAECACNSSDLRVRIDLTQALPTATTGTVEIWEGPGCADYASRTQEDHVCRKVGTASIADFTSLGSSSVALPISTPEMCASASSGVTVIAFTDPMQPFAVCDLRMPIGGQLVVGRPKASAARDGDGSVRLAWTGRQLLRAR